MGQVSDAGSKHDAVDAHEQELTEKVFQGARRRRLTISDSRDADRQGGHRGVRRNRKCKDLQLARIEVAETAAVLRPKQKLPQQPDSGLRHKAGGRSLQVLVQSRLSGQGLIHRCQAPLAYVLLQRSPPLTQGQLSAIRKIENTITGHLKPGPKGDIAVPVSDMVGNPIPKPSGGYWDHVLELQNTLRGLRNQAATLDGVVDPAAQAARQRALDAIAEIEGAIKGAGL